MKRLTTALPSGYTSEKMEQVIEKMGQFEDMIEHLEKQIETLSEQIDEYRQKGDIKNYRVRELAGSKMMCTNALNTLKQYGLY